jgi:hypothetical protein
VTRSQILREADGVSRPSKLITMSTWSRALAANHLLIQCKVNRRNDSPGCTKIGTVGVDLTKVEPNGALLRLVYSPKCRVTAS